MKDEQRRTIIHHYTSYNASSWEEVKELGKILCEELNIKEVRWIKNKSGLMYKRDTDSISLILPTG